MVNVFVFVLETEICPQWGRYVKVKQSHYSPEVPRGFEEVKVPRLRNNDPGWW